MRIIYILVIAFFLTSCDSFLKEKVLYEKYDNAIYIEDWDEAIRILDIIIDRGTNDADIYFLRAQAKTNQQTKDFPSIIKDLTSYLEKVNDKRALFIRAQFRFQNSQYEEAIQDIDTLIASQGEKSLLLQWKANSAYAAKKFQIAEQYYRALLRRPGTHKELREIYKKVVLCEYFNDNFEGAAWDVAFMESRGYERDSIFERQVINKELSFDITDVFETPYSRLDEIENELSVYCPEIDMKWHSGFYHTQLESELFREGRVTDLTSLLSKRLEIRRLSLRDTGIKELPKEIHQFIHIEELDLSRNKFSNVENLIADLSRLPNLKMLILDYTNLRNFPQNIALLQNLEVLSVEASSIKELPESLGELIHLKYLSVRHNSRLIDLPITIGNLKCMEIIDVSGSGISRLRNELADCTSLKSIVGNASRIKSLPEDIGKLQNLVYINLASNRIIEIPESIGELTNLKNLSLGSNDISQLPESFTKLKNLTFCGLSYNRFKDFPEGVLQLHKLQTLWLHNNSFKNIPVEVASIKSLQYMLVDHQIITDENIQKIKNGNPDLSISRHDTRKLVRGRKRKQ